MTIQPSEFTPDSLVSAEGGRVFTTSLIVAEAFGKEHKNVLQSIENLECSQKFNELNFQPVEYKDAKGELRPAFEMTRDGFVFLVMGFTGKKAAAWKEKFLEAFNAMEQALLQQAIPGASGDKDMTARQRPRFTPAPPERIKGFRGLITFWSSIEGVSVEELEARVLAAHGLPSMEYVQDWDLSELVWYVVKNLYRASGQVTAEEAPEEARRVLTGLLDFGCGLRGATRADLEGVACEMCNVPNLVHLSPLGVRKAELLLWTFLNRYPTGRDCLSEAKYAFKETSH